MITDSETLTALVAAHLHLGEARLSSLIEASASAASAPGAGEDAGLLLRLEEVKPPRRAQIEARRLTELFQATGCAAITRGEAAYPERLRRLLGPKAPPVLYVRGNTALFREPSVAIIGTRRPSADGRRAARSYAEALAGAGWMVTSGNAPGIDAAAHQAVLRAGGRTLVYPPAPLDSFEPSFDPSGAAPESLLVASPFAPGSPVEPWCFLRRNELVAAQSGASLVAETGARGGTLNTVGHVRRLERDLFVTDLPVTAAHRRAHEMLVAGGGWWTPLECTRPALEALLRSAKRPLPAEGAHAPDLFSEEVER